MFERVLKTGPCISRLAAPQGLTTLSGSTPTRNLRPTAPCLLLIVQHVFLVIRAKVLQQVLVWQQRCPSFVTNWRSIGFRICDGHIDFQVPDIRASKSLSHAHGISMRRPYAVEPVPVVEPIRLDHQRVTFPPADRIAVPTWFGSRDDFAAIEENLTVDAVFLVKHKNQPRRLHNFVGKRNFRLRGFADGLTVRPVVKSTFALKTFLEKFGGPRFHL